MGMQDMVNEVVDSETAMLKRRIQNLENEREYHQEAIADLEDRIRFMMSTVAGCQREDAIRYLHDVYNTHGDIEYLEHHLGVPYGYLSGRVF